MRCHAPHGLGILTTGCSGSHRASVAPDAPSTSLFAIDGVRLGLTPERVRHILGLPQSQSQPTVDAETGDTLLRWTYPGKRAVFENGHLEYLDCDQGLCVAGRGVQLGATTRQVTAAYGVGYRGTDSLGVFLQYRAGEGECGISFSVPRDTVRSVHLWRDHS